MPNLALCTPLISDTLLIRSTHKWSRIEMNSSIADAKHSSQTREDIHETYCHNQFTLKNGQ